MKKQKITPQETEAYLKLWNKIVKRLEKFDGNNDAKFEQGTYADGYRDALNDFFDLLNK